LTLAIALPGVVAFHFLPVAALPQVDFPTIGVSASLPGASPETMAATVATPLERMLGRISGLTEMTSSNTQGSTRINLQFDLDRDIDGAARDVQAAINAARALLPPGLPANPTYRKANAASAPILSIALTSATLTQDQLYDVAFTLLGQKISQVPGVGQVAVNGSALRAVRVEARPDLLNHYGLSLEDVRAALASANVSAPKGAVELGDRRWQIEVNDQARRAADYRELIVAWRNGAPVRLASVAEVTDSVQEVRNAGSSGGKAAVLLVVINQPGANIVETVDTIKALLPRLLTLIPRDVDVQVVIDRSTTIRRSLSEVEHTLLIAIALVVLVTFVFLRNARATVIPSVAIPVSLLGTLAVIALCGFSLNNLSLMALIISTGFVVDDAIVVVENVARHLEAGMTPFEAAVRGVREVGFTVVSMSVSLVAVFIPLLFMGGMIGRLFREFAVTLSVAVGISMVVSLTATPMLCAILLRPRPHAGTPVAGRRRWLDRLAAAPLAFYRRTLEWSLRHQRLMMALMAGTVALNVYLYAVVPKGFFPQQDTGRLQGFLQADQSTSFQEMRRKIDRLMAVVGRDPDIETFYEYTGGAAGGQSNTGTMYAGLRPLGRRKLSADQLIARLRPKLAHEPGVSLFLTSQQELSVGARSGGAQYQFTLLASTLEELRSLAPRARAALARLPELTDVSTDFQDKGLQTTLVVDREAAARMGVTASQIDATLNDAFSQRVVSTIYEPLNQYYVVLTLAPPYTQGPAALAHVYVTGAGGGAAIPLTAISHWKDSNAPLAVNHQGQLTAATISFNLAPEVSLEQATRAIDSAFVGLNPPDGVRGRFAGTVQVFRDSLASQPWLILAALLAVYIVLGILYESPIHPLTILSTLPSAGVGAILALIVFKSELSLISLIGIILLVGIVKKNAIMMIDAALQAEREQGLSPAEAIHAACLQRFRPILMTTLAAMFGALPLALGAGDGAELRRPLGISIVGGLVFSQVLTLYSTPVVYLVLDGARGWLGRRWRRAGRPQAVTAAKSLATHVGVGPAA
jgi:multidrug efflux pump